MSQYNNILSQFNSSLSANITPDKASVYFIGIGGIGMSALARYFNSIGVNVSGYDKTPTPLTRTLEAEGMQVHYEDNMALADTTAQLVIYTPAVPKNHTELNYFMDNGYAVVKRSDVLGAITNSAFNICVAGTHGKTTTSSMVAHILRHSDYGCNAFLGGIAVNYNSNFWSSPKNVCVAEADEYDRSFLKLSPDVAIISSMDPDHLDIYGTAENLEQAFIDFSKRVKPGGLLVSKHGLKRSKELSASHHITYSISDETADCHISNVRLHNGSYQFDVHIQAKTIKDCWLHMGGMHNIENALAAIAVAVHLGIDDEKIVAAVADFKGVKRRFEYIEKTADRVMIDDYAHHPQELTALLSSARKLFADRKCTVIFQPHLFSRTNDFADGFATALSLADEVLLLPIYPARELPMPGVTSEMVASKMESSKVTCLSKEALLENMQARKASNNIPSLLITAGAGDIDALVQPIKEILFS
ncbi:MAG: UDP-N-acetylmuramate--L-alanine ligase [Ferruginibacter sp.]